MNLVAQLVQTAAENTEQNGNVTLETLPFFFIAAGVFTLLGLVALPLRLLRLPIRAIIGLRFAHEASSMSGHGHPADASPEHARRHHGRGRQFDFA